MRRVIAISVLALALISSQARSQQAPVTGTIEGTVVRADNGEPIAGAQVTLNGGGVSTAVPPGLEGVSFRNPDGPSQASPLPRPAPVPPVTTGADGKFAFKGLSFGNHRIAATANGFVTTAYGQSTPFGPGGAEVPADMRVRRQLQTYRITGRITGTALPTNAQARLIYRGFQASGAIGTSGARDVDPATGRFDIQNVPPGEYEVEVQIRVETANTQGASYESLMRDLQTRQAQVPSGRTPVRVTDADLDDVVVNLTPPLTALGRFSVEGQSLPVSRDIQQMSISFTSSTTSAANDPVATAVAADGTFQVAGLRQDTYRVNLRGVPPPSLYLKSIQYGGEDILSKPLKFSGSGTGTFEVTFRSGAAQVSGVVTDAQSQPVRGIQVVLIPAQRDRGDLYRTTQTDQNGRFSITRLTPGEYKLFSWEAIDSGAHYDPEYLKQYEQQGRAIIIADGSNNHVDVRLIPER